MLVVPGPVLRVVDEGWGTMRWLIDGALAEGARLSLAEMTIHPGSRAPAHAHPNCDEALHVIEGHATLVVEEEQIAVAPGSTALVRAGERHAVWNDGDTVARIIIAYSAGSREYVAASEERT